MRVHELIHELSKLDPDLRVACWTEDEELLSDGEFFRILEIESVSTVTGETLRDEKHRVTMKIGAGERATTLATLTIVSQF